MQKSFLFALMASASMLAGPALAQQATPPETASQPEQATQDEAPDIIVTAQRQSERLQDVPVSVQAVSSEALVKAGVADLRQLSQIAPSLQVQQDNNYAVRGVGTSTFANTIESSVATAIDDVTLGNRVLNGNPFLDIVQVEVLNGPQGLLFGKNASAGLVNITTARPELGNYGAALDAEAVTRDRPGGNGNGALARTMLNIPIGETAALRLNGIYRYDEPIIKNVRTNAFGRYDADFRQFGGRGKFLYEPTDNFLLYLIGEYFEQHGVGTIFDGTYRTAAATGVNAPYLRAAGVVPGPRNLLELTDAPEWRDLTTGGAQVTASYRFGNDWTLSNIFAWKTYSLDQQVDGDGLPANGANVNAQRASYDQYSNELRLALPGTGPLTGQVGLYYFSSTLDQRFQIAGNNLLPGFLLPNFPFCVGATVGVGPCRVSNNYFLGQDKDYRLKNESYAAFGQFTYEVVDGLKLIAGGRITRDKVSIDLDQNRDRYFVVLGVPNSSFDQKQAATTFSYRMGGQYTFSRDLMVYATYGRGWKGPGMNDTGASLNADLRVRPERADTWEAGVKSQFFDRVLTLNASVFHTEFSNLQAQTFDTNLRAFVIGNAGKATSQGAEVSAIVRVARGLTLSSNLSYVDAKYDSFLGAQCYPNQPGCAANGTFDASGNRLTFAPKLTATVAASYEVPVSEDGSLALDAGYYHRSSVESIVSAPPGSAIEPLDLLNASIGFQGKQYSASLFCKNCTNQVYALQTGIEPGDSNAGVLSLRQRIGIDSVRSIGVRFGFNF